MSSFRLLTVAIVISLQSIIFLQTSAIEEENDFADSVDLSDRIGININSGHAHSIGRYGSSGSNTAAYGVQTEIQYPNGVIRPFKNYAGAVGNQYSHGPMPPRTYSQSNTNLGPGYASGGSQTGYYGGIGSAHTKSYSQNFKVPLSNGAVLLSNLPEKINNHD